ncbi:DUF1491 family protein [Phaeovulum sp.]|uniref:DUF1491 family protein n=1 Tax=Phaeovulum sp. TaxID=2934796 RepID=UPI0039E7239D
MDARLTADFWVRAYLARLGLADIPAYITRRGDASAGAVLVKCALLDGNAVAWQRSFDLMTGDRVWVQLTSGPEPEVDATIARQCRNDPDLWVIEIESRDGRTLLDEPGLSD